MTFVKILFFCGEGLLAPRPTPQDRESPVVVCARLLTQYIGSYPP
jgi:hypothetical protein